MFGQLRMKGQRNLVMSTVFLRIAGRLRILVRYGLQVIQHVVGQLAGEGVDQIWFELLSELVDVLDCQIPEIEIVGKQGSRSGFGNLMDEAAATGTVRVFSRPCASRIRIASRIVPFE